MCLCAFPCCSEALPYSASRWGIPATPRVRHSFRMDQRHPSLVAQPWRPPKSQRNPWDASKTCSAATFGLDNAWRAAGSHPLCFGLILIDPDWPNPSGSPLKMRVLINNKVDIPKLRIGPPKESISEEQWPRRPTMTQSWINPSGQIRSDVNRISGWQIWSCRAGPGNPNQACFDSQQDLTHRLGQKGGSIPSVVFVPVWSAGFFGEASHSLIWARAYPASFSQTVDVTVLTRLTGLSTAGFKKWNNQTCG